MKSTNMAKDPDSGKGRPRFPRGMMPPAERSKPAKLSRNEMLACLERVAPLSKELVSLLNLPANAYRVDEYSFSSDPEKTIADALDYPLPNRIAPRDPADFHLDLSSRGSNVFCTLIDKKRKIIVRTSVRNMFVENGSWDNFQRALESALAMCKKAESKGEKFKFLLDDEAMLKLF